MEPPLVGHIHRDLIDRLETRFRDLQSGKQVPRLIVLSGASGVGKSRIVREFYRRLAAHQPDPPYWPRDLTEAGPAATAPLKYRKVLGPTVDGFVWPSDAVPSFLWWQVEASRFDSGTVGASLNQFQDVMHSHWPALWEAYVDRLGLGTRLAQAVKKQGKTTVRDLVTDQGIESLGNAMTGILGTTVPGLGFILTSAVRAGRYSAARAKSRANLRNDVTLSDLREEPQLGDSLADALLPLTRAVPAIIVLEDAQWADADLCQFIWRLAVSKAPAMVVATAWPEGLLLDEDCDFFARLAHELGRDGLAELWNVGPLDEQDRVALVHHFATRGGFGVDDAVVALIAEKYRTPLGLTLFMTSALVDRSVVGRQLGITPVQLQKFDPELRAQYKRMWAELPANVRDVLVLAALVSPRGVTGNVRADSAIAVPVFLSTLVAVAAVIPTTLRSTPELADPVLNALKDARDPAAWLLQIAQQADDFREPLLYEIAAEQAEYEYSTKVSEVAVAYAMSLGAVLVDQHGSTDLRNLAASHYLALKHHDGSLIPNDQALIEAGLLRARALSNAYRTRDGIAAAQFVLDQPFAQEQSGQAELKRELADMLRLIGEHRAALDLYQELSGGLAPGTGATKAAAVEMGWHAADCLLNLQQDSEALLALDALCEALPDESSPSDLAIGVRRLRAQALGRDRRRLDDATLLLEELLREQQSGEHGIDEQQIKTRHVRRMLTQRRGDVWESKADAEALVSDAETALGTLHEDTIMVRTGLASALTAVEEFDYAIELRRLVVAQRTEVLGPDNPRTLGARNDLGFTLQCSRKPKAAIAELERLITDKERVLGRDHPSTLNSLANLANAYRDDQQYDKAVPAYDDLIARRQSVLGPDHLKVLLARTSRLTALRLARVHPYPVAAARELAADCRGAMGQYAVEAMRARFELAEMLLANKEISEAKREHTQLAQDRLEALGPDHPDTLQSRRAVADLG